MPTGKPGASTFRRKSHAPERLVILLVVHDDRNDGEHVLGPGIDLDLDPVDERAAEGRLIPSKGLAALS